MNNKKKGFGGEALAKRFLADRGYRTLETNYTTNLGEIDLIVTDNRVLVFVEVKTRTSSKFGMPSEAVGIFKQRTICNVAAQYIKRHQLSGVPVRFDVIEVLGEGINHIINAFDSYLRH